MATATKRLEYGASVHAGTTDFRVWAPRAKSTWIQTYDGARTPMSREGDDYVLSLPLNAGERYFYVLDKEKPIPDPVSRLLPEGVHGPTEIVDPTAFSWRDRDWPGVDLRDFVIYELHTGTFTPEGTFDSAIAKLPYLKDLGITAVEVMPVAAFPGNYGWGYDGVSLYAVHASYGGPEGLRRLVDAAHTAGLAVLLDVVYNHLGPEGNYLSKFGPYFTDQHHTPWGDAINYDQAGSAAVRRFVIDNALYWLREYHLDGLRLDATQTIRDDSGCHIVAAIASAVHELSQQLGRKLAVIAETDENDAKYLRPRPQGFGVDAVWSDDFHHSLHAHLSGERQGHYQDFGDRSQIVRALNEGFVFQGEAFQFWEGKSRGTAPTGVPLFRHVICTQNHDQVGNRALGERETLLVPRGARKLAAALLLLAPHTPMLWMGQEYDETAPFQFFSDFGDPQLQKAVREGRRNEFKKYQWTAVPDPQDLQTFLSSKLSWNLDDQNSRQMLDWYRALLKLRRELVVPSDRTCRAELRNGAFRLQVPAVDPRILVLAAFPDSAASPELEAAGRAGSGKAWKQALAASEDGFRVAVYRS